MQNQTFGEMLKAALLPLQGRDPVEIARRCGFAYDEQAGIFCFASLGREIRLRWPDCAFQQEMEPWQQLVILHYMDGAAPLPLSGRLIPFGAQAGGMVRGGGFDRECEERVRKHLGICAKEILEYACRQMGARLTPSNADLCAEFSFLPLYTLTLKIWFADEELEASGRMFLDDHCRHSLGVEDSVTVGMLILDRLIKLTQSKEHI